MVKLPARLGQAKDKTASKPSTSDSDTRGILAYIPPKLVPYAELARINVPGVITALVTHLCGLFQAATMQKLPFQETLLLMLYFLPACQVLMSVNCAWNDFCDADIDTRIPRTNKRPLARKAITPSQAFTFTAALAGVAASLLLPLPIACKAYAFPLALGCLFYPLSKRVTDFPQFVLGVVLAGGVLIGAAAGGVAALPYPTSPSSILDLTRWSEPNRAESAAVLLNYLTSILWTVVFETIYSYQDAAWDEAANVRTITRIFRDHKVAKLFLSMLGLMQIASHIYAGVLTEAHSIAWQASVLMLIGYVITMIVRVDLACGDSCQFWFGLGNLIGGNAMLCGYVGEYLSV